MCHIKLACGKSTTEFWQVGIVHRPITELTSQAALDSAKITWLPIPDSFHFIADPFGIDHESGHTILVEAYDYRVKRGEVHYYAYDQEWNFLEEGVALKTNYHLSYPQIIQDGGETYMLPEQHRSGKLTLYRASRFPDQWQPTATLLDRPAIDASVIQFENRWWMFYALPGKNHEALRQLHIAYADSLTGPWQQHSMNPVRDAQDSARPGGTPFIVDGKLHLPTQDCTQTYGGAINLLRFDELTPATCRTTVTTHLAPASLHETYRDGLHTVAALGDVTLIDVKKISKCHKRRWINLERRVRRLLKIPA